ncbi:MAG TPA: aldo/keto reductase [Usitatibacter sp.]|nr:aldo/keto reductase [Usitatibacter sp.]
MGAIGASSHSAPALSAALGWLMARPAISAPIAGATSLAQLRERMAAADLALDARQMGRLDRASD